MIEQSIFEILTQDNSISALVNTRVYPAKAIPQQAIYPLIAWQRIAGLPEQSLSGPNALEQTTIEIVCLAATHLAAAELADAVQEFLDGYKDSTILSAALQQYADVPSLQQEDKRTLFGVSLEFMVWFVKSSQS